MRQRLGLAAALLTTPRLLVLDEPANGLDPAGKRHVHRVITGLAENGTAVVLSSHRMDDLAALCSEVTLLATGRVVFSGPVGKLAAESGELDYRLLTSDPAAARAVALDTPGLHVVPGADGRRTRGPRARSGPRRAGRTAGARRRGGTGAGARGAAARSRVPGPDRARREEAS